MLCFLYSSRIVSFHSYAVRTHRCSQYFLLLDVYRASTILVGDLPHFDDIIIFGRMPQELLDRMRTILDKLREVRLKVKPSKCVLFKTEIQYLGHLVSEAGINPMPDKIQALKDWPTPNCLTDVRAFL